MQSLMDGPSKFVLACWIVLLCAVAVWGQPLQGSHWSEVFLVGLVISLLGIAHVLARHLVWDKDYWRARHRQWFDRDASEVFLQTLHFTAWVGLIALVSWMIYHEFGLLVTVLVTATAATGFVLGFGPQRVKHTFLAAMMRLEHTLDRLYSVKLVHAHTSSDSFEPNHVSFHPDAVNQGRSGAGPVGPPSPYPPYDRGASDWPLPLSVLMAGLCILGVVGLVSLAASKGLISKDTSPPQSVVDRERGSIRLKLIQPKDLVIKPGEFASASITVRERESITDLTAFDLAVDPPLKGASINRRTGKITVETLDTTPPGDYEARVRVNADGRGPADDEKTFTIKVEPVAHVPSLAKLSHIPDQEVVQGESLLVDADVKSQGGPTTGKWKFSLKGSPTGMMINPDTGVITWNPTQDDEPGEYQITVKAQNTATAAKVDDEVFIARLSAKTQPPELGRIEDKVVAVGDTLAFNVNLKSRGSPAGKIRYKLKPGHPDGAAINDKGHFEWSPTNQDRAGTYEITVVAENPMIRDPGHNSKSQTFRVTLEEGSRAPRVAKIPDQTVEPGETLAFKIPVEDPGHPPAKLSYKLGKSAPPDAKIDATGVFTWTPEPDDATPEPIKIAVRVTNTVSGEYHDEKFAVQVSDNRRPPVVDPIVDQDARPGEPLVLRVNVRDRGGEGRLKYQLGRSAPVGATISNAGEFRWAPPDDESADTHQVSIRVRNETSGLTSEPMNFRIHVAAERRPPKLAKVGIKEVGQGKRLQFKIGLQDQGNPRGALKYGLRPGHPSGATIDERSGVFSWIPQPDDEPGDYKITVRVHNPAQGDLDDEETFYVTVVESDAERPAQNVARHSEPATLRPIEYEDPEPPVTRREIEVTPDEPDEAWIDPKPHQNSHAVTSEPKRPASRPTHVRERDEGLQTFTNSIDMKLVLLPPGEFLMGSHESAELLAEEAKTDVTRFADELPLHRVRITKEFLMGTYEVTVREFREFVRETGYKTEAERTGKGGYGFNPANRQFEQGVQFNWTNPGWTQSDNHPVVNISWNDAMSFCRWLSKKEGRAYRLPSEAEWEYACRAGTSSRFYTGDDLETLRPAANLGDESFRQHVRVDYNSKIVLATDNERSAFTTKVGQFDPNDFGLFDMHGNVFEWCSDYYEGKYFEHSPSRDPAGPNKGDRRAIRGGSFYNSPFYCRSSFRNGFAPETTVVYLGFRVVLDLENGTAQAADDDDDLR